MPITKSAKKAMVQSRKRYSSNLVYKNKIKDLSKKIRKELATKNEAELSNLLTNFYSIVDKAAKVGVLHQNKAANLKSKTLGRVEKALGKDIVLQKKAPKPKAGK